MDFAREIQASPFLGHIKDYLFRRINNTQIRVLRTSGLAGLADRIESLEYDARDFTANGHHEQACNVRACVRDYRIGMIKLPSNSSCYLYHEGFNLGAFGCHDAHHFLSWYLPATRGPIWKEEGNQTRPPPDQYRRIMNEVLTQHHVCNIRRHRQAH
ncbi:hypothetical protein ABW20_dc0100080 [Dactylellina cionopaga]|nr:hypothetical protein ABW20_dc0100080 [Dactylellina cionopaga]